jgi:hypothetical protein
MTWSRSINAFHFTHSAFVATFEPNAMDEELENLKRNQVWELVAPPPNCKPIGTKWVWKNKEGENGEETNRGWLLSVIARRKG